MGRLKKKGDSGKASRYLTRTQAIRRLQVSLGAFRRLCVLKGIFPRDPPKSLKKKNKTLYYIKDIRFLEHDALVEQIRDRKVWRAKCTRAKARRDPTRLAKLAEREPRAKLDPIIKERYPNFQDALNDLEDSLNLIFLFASFPHGSVSSQFIEQAQRLVKEWESYIILSRALCKVFVSIKGVYSQVQICGQTLTWLAPHNYGTQVPKDVDVKLMGTFLEFSLKLMGFVNYRLYHSIGFTYPPRLDNSKDDLDLGVSALNFDRVAKADSLNDEEDDSDSQEDSEEEEEEPVAKKPASKSSSSSASSSSSSSSSSKTAKKSKPADSDEDDSDDDDDDSEEEEDDDDDDEEEDEYNDDAKWKTAEQEPRIFDGLKFYLSREVPAKFMEFVIRAFGGQVFVSSPLKTFDPVKKGITHYVIDRPVAPTPLAENCDYVQPQWVVDSVNADMLLPVEEYAVGVTLPPHLSPFVDDVKAGYMPERAEQLLALKTRMAKIKKAAQATEKTAETLEQQERRFARELQAEVDGTTDELEEEAPEHLSIRKKKQQSEEDRMVEIMVKPRDKFKLRQQQAAAERKKRTVKRLVRKRDLANAAKPSKQQRVE